MFHYIEMGINKLLALFEMGVEECEEPVNWYRYTHKENKWDLEESS